MIGPTAHGRSLLFTIEGDLNNPQCTLREALAMRVTAGLGEMLGVSIRGVAEGMGTLDRKGVEALGEAAKGLGGALRQLVGGQKGCVSGPEAFPNPRRSGAGYQSSWAISYRRCANCQSCSRSSSTPCTWESPVRLAAQTIRPGNVNVAPGASS